MILVDTGPLVALCDERDALHSRAVGEIDRLPQRDLCVVAAVLTEACFFLNSRALRSRLDALLTRLEARSFPDEATSGFRDGAFAWLDRYADHEPDFADACLAVAASRDRTARIWTFDSEFSTTWRRPDGTKIPLAGPPSSRKRKRRA